MSYIQRAIEDLALTLQAKNQDYRLDSEFSNFEFTAKLIQDTTVWVPEADDIILTQIYIKLGRLAGLPDDPANESRLDTYKDLAGYATLLYAYALEQSEQPIEGVAEEDCAHVAWEEGPGYRRCSDCRETL